MLVNTFNINQLKMFKEINCLHKRTCVIKISSECLLNSIYNYNLHREFDWVIFYKKLLYLQGPSASAYVTYNKSEDALKAILAVNNVHIDGRTLKASLGTTKYCSHFLKGSQCQKQVSQLFMFISSCCFVFFFCGEIENEMV